MNEFFWNIPVATPEGLRTHIISFHMNYREYGHIFSLVKQARKVKNINFAKGNRVETIFSPVDVFVRCTSNDPGQTRIGVTLARYAVLPGQQTFCVA